MTGETIVAQFMMLMKGNGSTGEQWATYIDKLNSSGLFRGGSALGSGQCVGSDASAKCSVNGFMRFESDTINDVIELAQDNPLIKAGGAVEVLELIET